MKQLIFLLVIFSASLSAQKKEFKDLFTPAIESCFEKEERLTTLISQNSRAANGEMLDSLLNYWQEHCDGSEALIRTRILHELSVDAKLKSDASLAEYLAFYINNLYTFKGNDSFQAYLLFSTQWAEELLASRDWPEVERFSLEILSQSKSQAATNKLYHSRNLKLDEGKETEKYLNTYSKEKDYTIAPHGSIGYANTLYRENIGDFVGIGHGLSLSLGLSVDKHNFGLEIFLSIPVSSDSVRINLEGITQKSIIDFNFYFGGYYAYEFIKLPRSSLAFRTSLGGTILSTKLQTYDEQNDTEAPFDLSSLSLGIGLEWKVRVYGTYQIGLRSSYFYNNFNGNNELRSNLNGGIIQSGLFFGF
jgi:hypothetical protein